MNYCASKCWFLAKQEPPWKIKLTLKSQKKKKQFIKSPFEAGSKNKLIATVSHAEMANFRTEANTQDQKPYVSI